MKKRADDVGETGVCAMLRAIINERQTSTGSSEFLANWGSSSGATPRLFTRPNPPDND